MLFDMKCSNCEEVRKDVFLPFEHDEGDHPKCCRMPMRKHYTSTPMVHWSDYDLPDGGFRAGKEKTLITTRKQNLDYMKRNNLLDANDFGKPPTKAEQMTEHKKVLESINDITPSRQQEERLRDQGLMDILER